AASLHTHVSSCLHLFPTFPLHLNDSTTTIPFFFLKIHRPPISTLFPYTTLFRSISSRSCCHPEPKRVCLTNATKELVLLSGANTRGAAVVGLISDLYRCLKQDVPVTLADSEVSALSSLVEAAHTEHLVYFLYPETESLADRVPHVPNGLSAFRGLRPVTGGGSWSCLRELVPKHVQRLAVGLQQSGHALRVPELVSQRHGRLRGVVVASGLPDGRQHLMDNPALELPCPLLPGAEDQGVQTGLVDHGNLLV